MSYEFRGTPGQWFMSNTVNNSGDMVYVVQGECGTEICNVWDCDDCSKSDAQLIAAAPELFEALESLEKMASDFDDGQYIDYPPARSIFESARAALAKATGQHQ